MKKWIVTTLILAFLVVILPFGIGSTNLASATEKIKEIFVANWPEVLKTKEEAKTVRVLGSKNVVVSHDDIVDVGPLGEVLYSQHEGSGTLKYLTLRGNDTFIGLKIEVDGDVVAQDDFRNLEVLMKKQSSHGWRLVNDDVNVVPTGGYVLEVNTPYQFQKSLKLYIINHEAATNRGGLHAEVETN